MLPSSPKIVWLIETIAQVLKQGGAPIILSRFNAPMFWLEMKFASLGVKSRVLHGDLSAAEKHLFVTDFQGGQFDVLLCQVKIAESWNATRCQDVIFLTRDWSPAMNSQGEDRAHRFGQKGTVNVQIPIVRNTIERLIHKKLLAKGVDAEQALRTVTIAELMENL
jgi:SWI/SNF-related matrix-associated actin-dependent regulator 1 of chromatin subfamily A